MHANTSKLHRDASHLRATPLIELNTPHWLRADKDGDGYWSVIDCGRHPSDRDFYAAAGFGSEREAQDWIFKVWIDWARDNPECVQ